MPQKPKKKLGPPGKLCTVFEGVTAYRDTWASLTSLPLGKEFLLPKGDGHPVLLIPGFLGHDVCMSPMKMFLESMNYKVAHWEGGINWGPSEETLTHIKDRLHEVYEQNGRQKVSLVGWSLGGIYARELAREFPDMVRDVISLGSPFQVVKHPDATVLSPLFSHLNPDIEPEIAFDPDLPIEPPMTSVYTQWDGIVHWKTCLLPEDKKTENIEVNSSHLGLIFSPQVATILADRLAQPEGQWHKFAASKHPFSMIRHHKNQAHNKRSR
ncbi:MAG: alpha/beta hydrolase [Alphaproteobacteria bacterium]|nr:MAG: alpha/beta hydrolase [Alphaproteobacteria bacterium]